MNGVDNLAIFMALVSTAQTFLHCGRQVAKAMVQEGRKLMGFAASTIDVEEVLDTVAQDGTEQNIGAACEPAQQEAEKQQTPPSTESERRSAFGAFTNTARRLEPAMQAVKDASSSTPEFAQQVVPQQRPLQPAVA